MTCESRQRFQCCLPTRTVRDGKPCLVHQNPNTTRSLFSIMQQESLHSGVSSFTRNYHIITRMIAQQTPTRIEEQGLHSRDPCLTSRTDLHREGARCVDLSATLRISLLLYESRVGLMPSNLEARFQIPSKTVRPSDSFQHHTR